MTTVESGDVQLIVYKDDGDVQLIVCKDDDDGIVTEEKEKIFERGFGKNTGLGLALSQEILDISGITITGTGELGKDVWFGKDHAEFYIAYERERYENGRIPAYHYRVYHRQPEIWRGPMDGKAGGPRGRDHTGPGHAG